MVDTADGFARRFGEVYQTQWFYGDGAVDLVEQLSKIAAAGVELAEILGMQHLKIDEGGFRVFRPLVPESTQDTLLLLERYDNLQVWASAESAAQTSPLWMKAILEEQANAHTWLGEGSHMLDDALDPPHEITADLISVDWITYEPTKQVALVEFPQLVRELAVEVARAGFSQTSVRYFGMTTAAGADLNLAHIWLEHASPGCMGEVLAWRQSAPELRGWKRRLEACCGSVRSHNLLTQIG
jgi:hypothetical protein